MKSPPPCPREPLRSLSVVIPVRNEEGCIAATVEHLHLELRLQHIPHEIVVVDDGSGLHLELATGDPSPASPNAGLFKTWVTTASGAPLFADSIT